MKRINVKIHPPCDSTHSSLQIWDFFHAYRQYLNRHNNYASDVDICISSDVEIDPAAINIGWYYMPDDITGSDCFDLIIVDAQNHHLEVSTECMYNAVKNKPNCFYVTGAYVNKDHEIYNKIILTPATFNTLAYFTRPFYPQYYEKINLSRSNQKNLIYVNGQNRSNRQYFMELLQQYAPNVDIADYLNSTQQVHKLNDSFYETDYDRLFREFVNSRTNCLNSSYNSYYDNSIKVGIQQKFGVVPPGYFMMDEYYQYQCIVFPESPWLNDEVFVTEKIIKCCVAECIPFPVGGANTHKLYNQMGYYTAWNLLPENLRLFDNEPDHMIRYQLQAKAAGWLSNRKKIWQSSAVQNIVKHNKNVFFSATHDDRSALKLNSIIESLKKWQQIST
jgi:hypothetical protein